MTPIWKRYQVMDFGKIGMNAACVEDEIHMLLKRVTSRKAHLKFSKK